MELWSKYKFEVLEARCRIRVVYLGTIIYDYTNNPISSISRVVFGI